MTFSLSYCGEMVREYDRDRFLISLFAPPEFRADLWALFAFNIEIAKTREVVTETRLGLIRLQWWREGLDAIYNGAKVPEHEVLQALAAAINAHHLPREPFDTLLYAREFDLEDVQPANLEGLVNYADFTTSPLMALAAQIAGNDVDPAQATGVNYGLAGIVRAIPFHALQRRCYLPTDLLKAHGVRLDYLYEGKPQEGVKAVVAEVLCQVMPGSGPKAPVLRAANRLAGMYAGQIKRLKYDVFSPRMAAPPFLKELRLILATKLG